MNQDAHRRLCASATDRVRTDRNRNDIEIVYDDRPYVVVFHGIHRVESLVDAERLANELLTRDEQHKESSDGC